MQRPSDSPDFDDIFDDFEEEDNLIFGSDEEGDEQDEVDDQDSHDDEEQDGAEYLADTEANGCEQLTITFLLFSFNIFFRCCFMGSGCGSDGREVASDIRGPWFESSHSQLLNRTFVYCQL